MNEGTTYLGTGACLLQSVYSINNHPRPRENTFSLLTNPVTIKSDIAFLFFLACGGFYNDITLLQSTACNPEGTLVPTYPRIP